MAANKISAEIVEFDDARARLRTDDIDPRNFLTVGPYLEALRVNAEISVDTLAERTHIKPQYIEAIEAMALDELPAKPFAIGFVRSYAEALGLEPAPIVERFKTEAGFDAPPSATSAAPVEKVPDAASNSGPSGGAALRAERPELSLLAAVAIISFIIWCAFWITRPRDESRPLQLDALPAAAEPAGGQAIMDPAAGARLKNGPEAFDPGRIPAAPALIEAKIIERVEPVYPRRCETGAASAETVEVAFTITVRGAVVSERIAGASNSCFERAALNAVRQWRFEPRTVDGAPRAAFDQRVVFTFDRPV